jgi:hypothetical protein
VIGDLNGDGRPDIVAANELSNTASVFLGTGSGTFASPGIVPIGSDPFTIAIGDVSGDGKPDLVSANATPDSIYVLLGDGTGTFGAPTGYNVGSLFAPYCVAIGDVDGDGKPDLATANYSNDSVSIFHGNGLGAFGTQVTFPVGQNPRYVAIGDLNNDGRPDLAVANQGNSPPYIGTASVLLSNGLGGFSTGISYAVGNYPYNIVISDLNGDGKADLTTADFFADSVSVLLNQSPTPTGLAPYGFGTPGCAGRLGMGANIAPNVNAAGFALTCTNAPPSSTGLGLLTNSQDLFGSDPFGIGILLHVDLLFATQVLNFDFKSDAGGSGSVALPIPNNPGLAGSTFFAQTIWIEHAADGQDCSPGLIHLLSSRGISITIQP